MLYLLFIATVSYPPHLHTSGLDIVSKYILGKVPSPYFVITFYFNQWQHSVTFDLSGQQLTSLYLIEMFIFELLLRLRTSFKETITEDIQGNPNRPVIDL